MIVVFLLVAAFVLLCVAAWLGNARVGFAGLAVWLLATELIARL